MHQWAKNSLGSIAIRVCFNDKPISDLQFRCEKFVIRGSCSRKLKGFDFSMFGVCCLQKQ